MRNNEAADIRSCQRLHYLFNSSCQTFLFFFPCGPQCKDNKEDSRYYNKCCCTHNTISLMYTAFLTLYIFVLLCTQRSCPPVYCATTLHVTAHTLEFMR